MLFIYFSVIIWYNLYCIKYFDGGEIMYKNKKIFILGMARSGYEVAKLLSSDNEIFITDMKEQEKDKVEELEKLGVTVKICNDPIEYLDDSFDIMVKNPGIKYTHPCVVKAKELGIPVINEVEVAYHYIDKNVKIIGVTGSNGKTTTTSIIYEIMKKAFGDKVILAGNIGTPLCHYAKDIKKDSYLVMEISDHQLCDMYDFKTNVSVMTNIYECHTDFHDSHERYVMTKKKIFNNHSKDDIAIINMDNSEEMELTSDIVSTKEYFSCDKKTDCYYKDGFIYYKDEKYIDTSKIILKGNHNYQNIMCAILATKVYGVSDEIIKDVVSTFSGVEHRLEYVGNINGREVYNDSKSTNTESTVIALNSFDKDTILIMGGTDRGHSFEELKEPMKHTKLVVAYGETKNRIKEFCDKIRIKCIVCDNLVEATGIAYDNSKEGDIILLSPACASWDQFPNFETRGKLFKDTILKYKKSLFLEKGKHIYMMGIGGISMSGIADILVNMGYKVSGSDRMESSVTDKLTSQGIKVLIPQSKDNITKDIDFIVYTAAIKDDNEEMIEAKKNNIPMMERGEFLGEITKLYSNTIGVAGTHGKTSTTSMLSCIFLKGNMDPTIQVGSMLKNINGNYRVGKSDTLIIEACEYCDSYLNFKQKSAIVLNIDNDHLDYFKNLDNIKKSFYEYVSHLPSDGYLVINNDDDNSNHLKEHTKAKVITYGINNQADYMADNIKFNKDGCGIFDVIYDNKNLGTIELSVPGRHNISNALSTVALSMAYGIDFNDIKEGLKDYEGAARRMEYKGEFMGAKVYDDYGHHPTEIEATAKAIHGMEHNETWVIFEPHTYSRAYKHKEAFAKVLSEFDHIIITDIYAARENNTYGIKEEDIIKEIKKYGKEAFHISNYDDIKTYLSEYVNKGDLILTLGAGYVTKLADLLVNKENE